MDVIWGMGAEHTEREKLEKIVNQMEDEYRILQTPYISNKDQMDYISSKYDVLPHFMYDRMSYVAEEKYDGWDYLAEEGQFISRDPSSAKGREGEPVIKTANVDPIIVRHMKHLYERYGVDIQGEIYIPGGTSDDVTTIMGCSPEKAQQRIDARYQLEKSHMMFVMLDIRKFMGKDVRNEPWYIRRALLECIHNAYRNTPFTEPSEYCPISEIVGTPKQAFTRIVRAGGEGLVIKNTKAIYQSGKKPANTWIKAKKAVTLDVFIMDLDRNGTGKNANLFRALQVGIMEDRAGLSHPTHHYMGTVHSGISDELRRDIFENWPRDQYRVIELEAMEVTKNGFRHGRFIRFREDKHWSECYGETAYKEEII